MEFKLIICLLSVFAVSAFTGISRCLHNGDYKSVSHLFAVASFSGSVGFAVVSLLLRGDDPAGQFDTWHLGLAAIIGLAGKEQTAIVSMIWKRLVKGGESISE